MATTRTADCGPGDARSRLARASLYLEVATLVVSDESEVATANVAASMAVLAGIAGSDAACCARLKVRPRGQDHRDALDVLRTVDPGGESMAKDLARLLAKKDDAHYGVGVVAIGTANDMIKWARRLVDAARVAVEMG